MKTKLLQENEDWEKKWHALTEKHNELKNQNSIPEDFDSRNNCSEDNEKIKQLLIQIEELKQKKESLETLTESMKNENEKIIIEKKQVAQSMTEKNQKLEEVIIEQKKKLNIVSQKLKSQVIKNEQKCNKQMIQERQKIRDPDIGSTVCIRMATSQQNGVVRFKGETKFKQGYWFGIELDGPYGKNNGSVQGVHYFTCKPKYGVFCKQEHFINPKDNKNDNMFQKYQLLRRKSILEKKKQAEILKKILTQKKEIEKKYNLLKAQYESKNQKGTTEVI